MNSCPSMLSNISIKLRLKWFYCRRLGEQMFCTLQVRELSPDGGPSGFSGLDEESEIWKRTPEDDIRTPLS